MSVSGKSYGAGWHDLDVGRWAIPSRLRESLRMQADDEPLIHVQRLSHLTPDKWRCKLARAEGERIVTETRYLTEDQLRALSERGVRVV